MLEPDAITTLRCQRNMHHVTISIPYFRCKKHIRRAVESVLAQTYPNLTVIVVNDADPNPPWDQLSEISDPRLVRFDLPINRGPYFATAAVLNACSSPYLMIQDSDDWSLPDRLNRLLSATRKTNCDFVGSGMAMFRESAEGWPIFSNYARIRSENKANHHDFSWRFSHAGLWRTASLKALGGYYAGFRVSYDLFLTNVILALGTVQFIDAPLYYRVARPTSLTVQSKTGLRSPYRAAIERALEEMYREVLRWQAAFLRRRISAAQLFNRVAAITQRYVSPEQAAALHRESNRLSAVLSSRYRQFTGYQPSAGGPDRPANQVQR